MPKLSVIVPVYGQLPLVLRLCRSLVQTAGPLFQTGEIEAILVDDHSPDFDLRDLVGPPFRVLRNLQNLQFVATENLGARQATGEWLLFLNSDIVVHPGWLEPLLALAAAHPNAGVIGPKLLYPLREGEVDAPVQSAGGLYDSNKNPFHVYLGWKGSDRRVNRTRKVAWVTGAALMTPRALFEALGGLDEAYGRGYFDDPDYCERVKQAGYAIWYCAESVMTHIAGQSMSADMKSAVGMTPEKAGPAVHSFRANYHRFHARWDAHITPDVTVPMVAF